MKALDTKYKGYNFRSRLEARYAIYFDKLNIKWEYEKEGYALNDGTCYLPDFWLSEFNLWVEIKGTVNDNVIELMRKFRDEDNAILLLSGVPGEEKGILFCRNYEDSARFIYKDNNIVIYSPARTNNNFFAGGKELERITNNIDLQDLINESSPGSKTLDAAYSARSARFDHKEKGDETN